MRSAFITFLILLLRIDAAPFLLIRRSLVRLSPLEHLIRDLLSVRHEGFPDLRGPARILVNSNTTPISTRALEMQVDSNGDGVLSLPEVQYAAFVHHGLSGSVMEQLFQEVDKDHDDVLSFKEFDNIRPLVLAKAENAALHYMKTVDTDGDGKLSLPEAQAYILREYGIGSRDVERVWKLVISTPEALLDEALFAKLRRRIRGMTIRLARQIMKTADTNGDGHISLAEAQSVAFEQEGIGAEDVAAMVASVDDNEDGELNAPEFADFERIVRAKAVETSKRALKAKIKHLIAQFPVVDTDGSGTLALDEAKRIAFEHYGFDESVLGPYFAQADENEDGELDAVEFAGFRSVIRSRAVKNAVDAMPAVDLDGDGLIGIGEAEMKTAKEDDMESSETRALFNIADQNKSGKLDRVEFADFIRLVRLSAIKFAADHFPEFDVNGDGKVAEDELTSLIVEKYEIPVAEAERLFRKADVDQNGNLIPAEIVDFRHFVRSYVRTQAAASGRSSPFPILNMPEDLPLNLRRKPTVPEITVTPGEATITQLTTTPPTNVTGGYSEEEKRVGGNEAMPNIFKSLKMTPSAEITMSSLATTTPIAELDTTEREEEEMIVMPNATISFSEDAEENNGTAPFISSLIDEVSDRIDKEEGTVGLRRAESSSEVNDYVPDDGATSSPQDEALDDVEAELDLERQQQALVHLRRQEQLKRLTEMITTTTSIEARREEEESMDAMTALLTTTQVTPIIILHHHRGRNFE